MLVALTDQIYAIFMRINRYIAQATGLSRRAADKIILENKVSVNGQIIGLGYDIKPSDLVSFTGKTLALPQRLITIILNKPIGYVCSRAGQGSKTIYDLLPKNLHNLKPVGRLDKDSSGLLLLTNDGSLANTLTHPSFAKEKVYEIKLDKPLAPEDLRKIKFGIMLNDGISKLKIKPRGQILNTKYQIQMTEGRNRQIRRTFAALGFTVTHLHRTHFGPYRLDEIASGSYQIAK